LVLRRDPGRDLGFATYDVLVKLKRELRLDTVLIWMLRFLIGILPFIGAGVGLVLDDRSRDVQVVGTALAWTLWGVTVVASFVSHPISLTGLRLGTPIIFCAVAVVAISQELDAVQIIGVAIGVAILLLSFSAEIGGLYVQASAYGDERRFALRPPVVLVAPVLLTALVVDGSIVAAPLLLAARNWWLGSVSATAAIASCILLVPRIHQLSRRWLVFVPAGLVVHDNTVLSMNLMIRKQNLTQIQLANSETQAADLTALTWGVPLELSFRESVDVRLSAIGARHLKALSQIHAQAILVSPSRPGAVLRAAREKNIRTN